MTREEHMKWCKDRAMEYVKEGDLLNAVASMMYDLEKHPETSAKVGAMAMLGFLAMQEAQSGDRDGVVRYIEGFN